MRNILDVYGRIQEIKPYQVFVTATDSFLSGWGKASGKTAKQVIICEDWTQAEKAANNMQGNGFKYINICRRFPSYSSARYTVSVRHISDCPLFLL